MAAPSSPCGVSLAVILTALRGSVTLTGTGASAYSSNHGIAMAGGTAVSTADAGMTITGTGGVGAQGSNMGVHVSAGAQITTVNGALGITGTGRGAGTGANSPSCTGSRRST